MKTCAMCHTELPESEFNKATNHSDGLASWCKSCNKAYLKGYNEGRDRDRTLERAVRAYRRHYDIVFIVSEMFHTQQRRSRKHAYKFVSYTQAQLLEFVLGHREAYEIHDAWVQSGFIKNLKLSVDRKDATKGYSLDNIQIMTWGENNLKGRTENRTKKSKRRRNPAYANHQ